MDALRKEAVEHKVFVVWLVWLPDGSQLRGKRRVHKNLQENAGVDYHQQASDGRYDIERCLKVQVE